MWKRICLSFLIFSLTIFNGFGAVTDGVNSGFVSSEPSADPSDSNDTMDYTAHATKATSPSGSNQITKMGWWCDNATEEANFEVGLYSHNAGTDLPNLLLASNQSNAKGTDAGWKRSTLGTPYEISASTTYWVAAQLDNTPTSTQTNQGSSGKRSWSNYATALPEPWSSNGIWTTLHAFYAYYTAVSIARRIIMVN